MNKKLLKESIQRKEKSLLFFNASWCGVCKDVNPIVEQIRESKQGYKFYNMNIEDRNTEEISEIFDIDYIPTLVVISETGYKTYEGKHQIKKLLS